MMEDTDLWSVLACFLFGSKGCGPRACYYPSLIISQPAIRDRRLPLYATTPGLQEAFGLRSTSDWLEARLWQSASQSCVSTLKD